MNQPENKYKISIKEPTPPAMGIYAFRVPKGYLKEAKKLKLDLPETLRSALHYAIETKKKAIK